MNDIRFRNLCSGHITQRLQYNVNFALNSRKYSMMTISYFILWMSVVIHAEAMITSSSAGLFDDSTTVCPKICRNGPNAGQDACSRQCNCTIQGYELFLGDECETLNLDSEIVNLKITARTVNFTWIFPPDLNGSYSFVYMLSESATEPCDEKLVSAQSHSEGCIYTRPLKMLDENTTRLIDLDSGGHPYVICLTAASVATDIKKTSNISRLSDTYPDCVDIITEPTVHWYFTLTFYVVLAFMLFTISTLIVMRIVCDQRNPKNSSENSEMGNRAPERRPIKSEDIFINVVDLEKTNLNNI